MSQQPGPGNSPLRVQQLGPQQLGPPQGNQPPGQLQMPGPQPFPPQLASNAPAQAPWAYRAEQRAGFGTLVAVELRKLVGTLSDRITLIVAPLFLVGLILIYTVFSEDARPNVQNQVLPLVIILQLGQLLLYSLVIKLVAGEWQYKSVQPTLLVQPSRMRYTLAQGVVLFMLWIVGTVVTYLLYPPLLKAQATSLNVNYLIGMRPLWLFAVIALGTATILLIAFAIAMLIPNTGAAMTVYFLLVPVLAIFKIALPKVFSFIYPLEATFQLAGLSEGNVVPTIVATTLYVIVFALAVVVARRRDAG